MSTSLPQPTYRSMEENCLILANLKPNSHNWFVKVLVIEKTPPRLLKWGRHQKIIFIDKEKETMQSIIYDQDVDQLDGLIELYKTYYIGNAKIREITGNTPILGSLNHQMILSRSTYIKRVHDQNQLPMDDAYQLTPFAKCPEIADMVEQQINLLCCVVHVFPPRFVGKTKRNLQEFVIVNEEHRPLILTLWEEFLQTEAPYLTQNVHTNPIILGMRLAVNTFHGLSIGTMPNSTILFDPPIRKAQHLQSWMESNKEYIEAIVNEKLYDKANQPLNEPISSQIRKISQILSLADMVKSFWIKATLQIVESGHSLYFLACPACSKPCGAAYQYEFTCFYCNNNFPSPTPLLRFQALLSDGTGTLHSYVENNEGKTLLGMSGQDMMQKQQQEADFSIHHINEKFKDVHFLFQLRTSKNEVRGKVFTRNTIIKCVPSIESSSASHSSGEKTSSLHIQHKLPEDVTLVDSQESTSQSKEQYSPTNHTEQQQSSTHKRRLESKEHITQETLKHPKQD